MGQTLSFFRIFSAIPYGILFQLCFWSFFVQKASHNKNRISARFCPQSIELGKPVKIQAVWPRLQQCIVRFEPQFRYPFWTLFQISNFAALHCVRWNHEKSPNTGARQSQGPSFYEWTVSVATMVLYAALLKWWNSIYSNGIVIFAHNWYAPWFILSGSVPLSRVL